ncbi:PAS domain-containing sensor histidine kinase [Pseudoxanthomonas koreensis]|uniref:PAS domain-containing sensor histidine kinase n=1 Tax=Pseudoxanthomonas koreensis TaxID=266061 RepID=UPI00139082EA|nr:ATP-binding protein [Pseudoxanthomonas koreensis]
MNWVETLWPMISAAGFTLALVYCLAWLRTPARISHLFIGVAAASVAMVGLFELVAMNAEQPADYARMVRWAHVPVAISAICVVGFVFHHYGVGSPFLAMAAIATRIACLAPNFLTGVNLNYSTIDTLQQLDFLGTQVSAPGLATPNPWMLLGSGNALLVVLFLAHAIVQLARRSPSADRTRAIATCAAILVFAIASGTWTSMVVHGHVEAPHLFAPLFLGVLLAMASTLAGGFSSAGRLALSLESARGNRRVARRRMLQAAEAAGVGFWTLDTRSGRVRLSNHAGLMFGIAPGGALMRDELLARMPPADREAFQAAAGASGIDGFHCEFRVMLAGDRHRWLAAHGRLVLDDGNRNLDGVLIDITGRKESEAQFRQVIESASTPHLVVAPTGAVAFANAAAATIFGVPVDGIAGMDLRTLIRAEAGDRTATDAWLPSAGIGRSVEVVGIRRGSDAPVPLTVMFNPIPFESNLFLLVSLADRSGMRRIEREDFPHRDEVAHSSRVSLLETLSGSLAHELNQPLTAILANAQAARRFLEQAAPNLDEVRASLEAIAESDLRAAEIIKRLRALLRKDDSEFRPFAMAAAIEEATGLLRSELLLRETHLQVEVRQPLPWAWGDSIQIQQVILNLVMNACDAMADRAPPRGVTLRADVDGDHVRVTVEDHGSGIAAEDLERIFQPFHTRKRDGLGLGLAVCRMIVLAHGGDIRAESSGIGHGAAITFRLPGIADGDGPGPDDAAATAASRVRMLKLGS